MLKTQYKKEFCSVLLEKANDGILMETIGISMMVSIGLLLFFLAGRTAFLEFISYCIL